MKFSFRLEKTGLIFVSLLLFAATNLAADDDHAWRTWTSQEGAEIEAYLSDVTSDGIVIVRRDGREFTAPASRFSESDQDYVMEWLQAQEPSASEFRQLDFDNTDLPNRHTIDDVENVRPGSGNPSEAGAVQTVLSFHGIDYGPDLVDRIAAQELSMEEAIPPRDLLNALSNLPVEAETFSADAGATDSWQTNLNAIRAAISWDLPVILAYRPYFEPETPEVVVVAIAYDQRNLNVLEPTGGTRSVRLDLRDLDEQFVHAIVLFPKVEPADALAVASDISPPAPEFLSKVSAAIRQSPEFEPEALTEFMNEEGLEATVRDVNRSDLRNQMGQTRSFARSGGLPLIEAALDRGRVVVVPLDLDEGQGFALLYGRTDDGFDAVAFQPDRTFSRGPISRGDLARQWLTRVDRTYRLDLIEIEVPSSATAPSAPPAGGPPSNEPAPGTSPSR